MCRVLAENPARFYGLYPCKGVFAFGSDADIVVYDSVADFVITAADQAANVDYAPFEGFRTSGSIALVWLWGRKVVDYGAILVDRRHHHGYRLCLSQQGREPSVRPRALA